VSYFALVMSIGLLVDFNMHVLLRYYESPYTKRDEKVKDALQTMGSSVMIGGFSTFLGVLPLLGASGELMRALFYGFMGMVILGCSHGIILLPVLLSLFGPVKAKHEVGELLSSHSLSSKQNNPTRSSEIAFVRNETPAPTESCEGQKSSILNHYGAYRSEMTQEPQLSLTWIRVASAQETPATIPTIEDDTIPNLTSAPSPIADLLKVENAPVVTLSQKDSFAMLEVNTHQTAVAAEAAKNPFAEKEALLDTELVQRLPPSDEHGQTEPRDSSNRVGLPLVEKDDKALPQGYRDSNNGDIAELPVVAEKGSSLVGEEAGGVTGQQGRKVLATGGIESTGISSGDIGSDHSQPGTVTPTNCAIEVASDTTEKDSDGEGPSDGKGHEDDEAPLEARVAGSDLDVPECPDDQHDASHETSLAPTLVNNLCIPEKELPGKSVHVESGDGQSGPCDRNECVALPLVEVDEEVLAGGCITDGVDVCELSLIAKDLSSSVGEEAEEVPAEQRANLNTTVGSEGAGTVGDGTSPDQPQMDTVAPTIASATEKPSDRPQNDSDEEEIPDTESVLCIAEQTPPVADTESVLCSAEQTLPAASDRAHGHGQKDMVTSLLKVEPCSINKDCEGNTTYEDLALTLTPTSDGANEHGHNDMVISLLPAEPCSINNDCGGSTASEELALTLVPGAISNAEVGIAHQPKTSAAEDTDLTGSPEMEHSTEPLSDSGKPSITDDTMDIVPLIDDLASASECDNGIAPPGADGCQTVLNPNLSTTS
jgi:hypothetical protein